MNPGQLPELDLRVAPATAQILAGDEIRLAWQVSGADQVRLFEAPRRAWYHPFDWNPPDRLGTSVEPDGVATFRPRSTHVYGIAASTPRGRRSRAVLVDVVQARPSRVAPKVWHIDWDELRPVLRRRMVDDRVRRRLECLWRAPTATLRAVPRSRYTDQEATLRWTTGCARCVEIADAYEYMGAVEDLNIRTGTRVIFVEGGGSLPPPCSYELFGEFAVTGVNGPGDYTWTLSAGGISGIGTTAGAEVSFLPRPQFDGGDAARHSDIEWTLIDLYSRLSDGCIRDVDGLDAAIPAFGEGHLDRVEFWTRLRAELQNANLLTFRCNDTSDEDWRGSRWEEFGNTIDLDWSPNHAPDLPFVILHELIHKCGFHGDLEAFYTPEHVEHQAVVLTRTCV